MWKNILVALYLVLIGMGIVFLALFILAGFIDSIGRIERWFGRLRVKSPAAAEDELSPEEAVVISAAAATVLQKKVEIRRIRLVQDESQELWSRTGRLDIMHSHNLK